MGENIFGWEDAAALGGVLGFVEEQLREEDTPLESIDEVSETSVESCVGSTPSDYVKKLVIKQLRREQVSIEAEEIRKETQELMNET